MKRKLGIGILVLVIIAVSVIAYLSLNQEPQDNWVHKTFNGIVTDIWTDESNQYFTLSTSIHENEYSFVITDETLYVIDFVIGDKILVETDYNTKEHNGKDIPYPAVMVTDPTVKDSENPAD